MTKFSKIHREALTKKDFLIDYSSSRPIMSINRYSKLKDIQLQPFQFKIKSNIRDDIHFLNSTPQKKKKIDSDSFLVTLDVTNLHSNICHEIR